MSLGNGPVKTIFMYSGQGSQYYQMGADLYAANDVFRQQMKALDQLVRQQFGFSVLATLYESGQLKSTPFREVVRSSLAIFMVECALTETLIHYGCQPDAVLSLSMGSFAALCTSHGINREEMLTAIFRQAQAMEQFCCEGSMLAVLAPVALYHETEQLKQLCEIAAVNTATHFVITLPDSALAQVDTLLTARKVPFQRMPVSRAYHSHWIEAAKEGVLSAFADITFRQGSIPVHLCIPSPQDSLISAQTMWRIAREPICLPETLQPLEQKGAYRYIDVGPSGTMATLLKYILPATSQSSIHPILSPMGQGERELNKLLATALTDERI